MRGGSIHVIALCALCALTPGAAHAQTPAAEPGPPPAYVANSGEMQDIVVTARKQNESIMRTPTSVSAVTGPQLQALGLTTSQDISQRIPNLYLDYSTTVPHVAIRGLANVSTAISVDPAVGLAVDEVFLGTPKWIAVGQFDLQQLEVLRGPQGVYFGKNTTAGLINITTKGPTDILDGYVRVGHEFTTNEWLGEAALGGPITDTLGGRFAIQYKKSDGYMNNTSFSSKEPAAQSTIARGSIKWQPISDLTIRWMGQYATDNITGSAELYNCSPAFVAVLQAHGSKEDCTYNRTNSAGGSIPGYFRPFERAGTFTTTGLTSLRADWNVGDFVISSVSGFSDINARNSEDYSDSDIKFFTFNRPVEHTRAISQELRLLSPRGKPIEYLLGLYYYDADLYVDDEQAWNTAGIFPARFIRGTRVKIFRQNNSTYAGFGEVTWNITSSLRLLAGARYTEDRKTASINQTLGSLENPFDNNAIGFNLLGNDVYSLNARRKATNVSPSITAQWDFDPDAQIYASFKKGFKSGGFDSSLPRSTVAANFPFGDEHVRTTELGIKAKLFNNRIRMTASLFQSKYRDLQLSALIPPFVNVTLNAASATTKGFEFETTASVTQEITANLDVGYVDANYGSFPNGPCYAGQSPSLGCNGGVQNNSGKTLPLAPKWEINAGFDWQHPIGDYLLEAGIDGSFRSKVWIANDFDPYALQASVFQANARVSISTSDEKWTAALIGRNLLDQDYSIAEFPVPFFTRSVLRVHGAPRTVQIQVTRHF